MRLPPFNTFGANASALVLGEIFAPNQNGWFVKLHSINMRNKKRLTIIAVNILTTTPTPKLIAKPFTGPEPKTVKDVYKRQITFLQLILQFNPLKN